MQAATLTWQCKQFNMREFDMVEIKIGPQDDGVQGQERGKSSKGRAATVKWGKRWRGATWELHLCHCICVEWDSTNSEHVCSSIPTEHSPSVLLLLDKRADVQREGTFTTNSSNRFSSFQLDRLNLHKPSDGGRLHQDGENMLQIFPLLPKQCNWTSELIVVKLWALCLHRLFTVHHF